MLDAVVDYLPVADRHPAHRGHRHEGRADRAQGRARTSRSRRSRSRSSPTPTASSPTSASTRASSRRVRRSTTPPRTARSASGASCACTRTSARTSTSRTRATSSRVSASSRRPPATRSASARTRSSSSRWMFPEPVISVAIEPKTKADQDKLGKALSSLSDEDPTFRVHTDEETGPDDHPRHGRASPRGARRPDDARVQRRSARRQAAGCVPRDDHAAGREGRASATSARPAVAVSSPTSCIALEPTGPGGGYEFVDEIKGGVIPREYIPAVDAGIQEAMQGGVVAGYPLVDVRARLTFGSYHEVDSSEMAFKIAGSMAFKDAAKKAKADPARAGHGRRGRDRRRVHGRRDRRPQLDGAVRSRAWSSAAARR